jgi:hypothetical protein
MNTEANRTKVRANIANFCDPYFNEPLAARIGLQSALFALIQAGEVENDGACGYRITAKGRENQTIKPSERPQFA